MKIDDIVVVDVETSGPDVFENDLLSIFVCSAVSEDSIELYLDHDSDTRWSSVGKRYFNMHKSTWEEKSESANGALIKLNSFIDSRPSDQVVFSGHNVAFDYYFIRQAARKHGVVLSTKLSHRLVDTHSIIAMKVMQGLLPKYTLKPKGAAEYFDIPVQSQHSAKFDALLSKEILHRLLVSSESAHSTVAEG